MSQLLTCSGQKPLKDPILMNMLRRMVVLSMIHNVLFSAVHIKGKHNIISDMLSRFQIEKAQKVAPWLDKNPTDVPRPYLPWCPSMLT